MTPPDVSVAIPTWNSSRWLPGCLDALEGQTARPREIVVADSASSDGTPELAAGSCRVERLGSNRGFAAAANVAWRACRSEWVALLNPDTRVEPEWLEALTAAAAEADDRVAAVASLMLQWTPERRIDDAGDEITRYGAAVKRLRGRPQSEAPPRSEVFAACGGAALYRRRALEEVGGFAELFESYLEDVDLGFRLRLAGWRTLFEPTARVLHEGGVARPPRGRYVRLATRNRLFLLTGCLPATLAWRWLPQLLWGQVYFAVAYHRPWQSLLGYLGFLSRLAPAWSRRRAIQTARRLPPEAVADLVRTDLGEPPLRALFARRSA